MIANLVRTVIILKVDEISDSQDRGRSQEEDAL
jgi:hypothetical protein